MEKKYFKILICVSILLVIVSATMAIFPTISWLNKTDNSATNSGSSSVATAGIELYNDSAILGGSDDNILQVKDLSSSTYAKDIDETTNSFTVKSYGNTIFDNAWVVKNLKPSTYYIMSSTIEAIEYANVATENIKTTAEFCGFEIMITGSETVMLTSTITNLKKDNGILFVTRKFKTPDDLLNFRIVAFSGYVQDINGKIHYNTIRFNNVYLAEAASNTTQKSGGSFNTKLSNSGVASNLNLNIKNSGTGASLVRLYYNIKTLDNKTLTTADANVVINNKFIEHERLDTAWCGYLFLNETFDPNEIINIFTSITPTEKMANNMIIVQVSAECVLYEGNAYTTDTTDKYPWSSVPTNWFCL